MKQPQKKKNSVNPVYHKNVDSFSHRWLSILDEIDVFNKIGTEESERKLYEFIESLQFPADCRDLGFTMDCYESFQKKYGDVHKFFNESGKTLEEKMMEIDDLQVLGNALFSKWRYYNHWVDGPCDSFELPWFKAVLKRLVELSK